MKKINKQKISKVERRNITPGLQAYFRELKHPSFDPLDASLEESLFKRYKATGDVDVRNIFIKTNLRYVVTVAAQYQRSGVEFAELLAAGNGGLIDGVTRAREKFDVTLGFRVLTYLNYWIYGYIINAIQRDDLICRGHSLVAAAQPIDAAMERFFSEYGIIPSAADIAEDIEELVTAGTIRMHDTHPEIVSVSTLEESGFDSDTLTASYEELGSIIADPVDQFADFSLEVTREHIYMLLKHLTEREEIAVCAYYGIPHPALPKQFVYMSRNGRLDEVADRYYVTPERIRQLKERALHKMQRWVYKQYPLALHLRELWSFRA